MPQSYMPDRDLKRKGKNANTTLEKGEIYQTYIYILRSIYIRLKKRILVLFSSVPLNTIFTVQEASEMDINTSYVSELHKATAKIPFPTPSKIHSDICYS